MNPIKYSIIMPYYDRLHQLEKTLHSFEGWYAERDDFEIIIIEDDKQTSKMSSDLSALLVSFNHINITSIVSKAVGVTNPAIAFNEGVSVACGTYVMITNPECLHKANILKGLDVEFDENPDVYVVCGCMSTTSEGLFHKWFQHSEKRNRNNKYHWCSAVSMANYKECGGFNEAYAKGIAYDDNSFRDRIFKVTSSVSVRDDLLVVHQWHTKNRPSNYQELLNRNRLLYEKEANQCQTTKIHQ